MRVIRALAQIVSRGLWLAGLVGAVLGTGDFFTSYVMTSLRRRRT